MGISKNEKSGLVTTTNQYEYAPCHKEILIPNSLIKIIIKQIKTTTNATTVCKHDNYSKTVVKFLYNELIFKDEHKEQADIMWIMLT